MALGTDKIGNNDFVHHVEIKDKLIQISTGGYCGGGVTENGLLYVWGYAKKGRLGDIKVLFSLIFQKEETLP